MNQNDVAEVTLRVVVVLIDQAGWWLAPNADEDLALTLFAVVSEDPASWREVAAYWPRYRTPKVPEFADAAQVELTEEATVRAALAHHERWLVIDLVRKRITSGEEFETVGRDQAFAMELDEKGNQRWPLSIHLPPWWELNEQARLDAIDQPRDEPIRRPQPNRGVLFGEPMIEDLAERILLASRSQEWCVSGAATDAKARYPFTIQVHRDWLMTPRGDLDGKAPREMLHGAIGWIDRLVWAQRLRFEDCGQMIAAPAEVSDFDVAPMGREEICIFFDLCREIITAGWFWCAQNNAADVTSDDCLPELTAFLIDVKDNWLNESLEGGSPPRFIIECIRRRVPRGSGVAIAGMDGRESEQHLPDCDCPICDMMESGLFGVGFTGIDGHHLELDDEFAFSLCETRAEWQSQQREYQEFADAIDRKRAEREADEDQETDDFSSAWSSPVCDQPIPGDRGDHLRLAFLLAELVSALESMEASRETITELNHLFRQFREADVDSQVRAAGALKQHLDEVGIQYPELVSRSADFHSRVDESLRQTSALGDEFPF